MPVDWSIRMSSGRVVPVGEPAVGLVELQRGDAEVEQDAERGPLRVLRRAPSRCRRRRRARRRTGRRTGPGARRTGPGPPRRGRARSAGPRGSAPGSPRRGRPCRACRRRRPRRAPAAPARAARRCGRAARGRAVRRRLLGCSSGPPGRVRCGWCGWCGASGAGRPGGWSPSDPGPARGKSRRESGRLEAGSRVVVGGGGRSSSGLVGRGWQRAGWRAGRHSPGTTSSVSTE